MPPYIVRIANTINWFDIGVLAIIAVATLVSFRKGLISSFFSTVAQILALTAGVYAVGFLDSRLGEIGGIARTASLCGIFIIGFVAVLIVASLLFKLIEVIAKIELIKPVDIAGGIAFGIAQGLIMSAVLVIFIQVCGIGYLKQSAAASLTGNFFLEGSRTLYEIAVKIFPVIEGYPIK